MNLLNYLSTTDDTQRLECLSTLSGPVIHYRLVEQLLQLPLPLSEKAQLLNLAWCENRVEWEKTLVRGMLNWEQNLAGNAIKCWGKTTGHVFYHIVEHLLAQEQLPQRVLYTLVDICTPIIGLPFISRAAIHPAVKDYSPIFHGILLLRSLEFGAKHPSITELAKTMMSQLSTRQFPDSKRAYTDGKGYIEAAFWLIRHEPQYLFQIHFVEESWEQLVSHLLKPLTDLHWLDQLRPTLSGDNLEDTQRIWPLIPYRHLLQLSDVKAVLRQIAVSKCELGKKRKFVSSELRGISVDLLQQAVLETPEFLAEFGTFASDIQGLLCLYHDSAFRKELKLMVKKTKNIFGRLALFFDESLLNEQEIAILEASIRSRNPSEILDLFIADNNRVNIPAGSRDRVLEIAPDFMRDTYFNLIFSIDPKAALPTLKEDNENYWQLLILAHATRNPSLIEPLAAAARKQPFLFRILFFRAIGLYEGHDQATLKLMDFVRTSSALEMSEVILALGGINTPRSLQELIGCLTRKNVNLTHQLEICRILKEKDTQLIQAEIKWAIRDLNTQEGLEDGLQDVKDALASMILVISSDAPVAARTESSPDLDSELRLKIDCYNILSSEIKRALRTSQFFENLVQNSENTDMIELSPIIDMQYKAMELLFRECFEDKVNTWVAHGNLQRKLDVLGYSRPIPASMDEFENYIASLPIVRDIPFFSRFKLRKMLRGISQFQPGKRFTLDGVKAFALFFLVFSRKSCRFGLAEAVKIGFNDDKELAEYVKMLHIFQDFRNRAAHEGFRPEARRDLVSIWGSLATIFETTHQIAQLGQSIAPSQVDRSAG